MKRDAFKLICIIAIAGAIAAWCYLHWIPRGERYYRGAVSRLEATLATTLARYGVSSGDITAGGFTKKTYKKRTRYEARLTCTVRKKTDFEKLTRDVTRAIAKSGFSIASYTYRIASDNTFIYTFTLAHRNLSCTLTLRAHWIPQSYYHFKRRRAVSIAPKIAIVLDDWGYTLDNIAPLIQLHTPVTIAVLPRLTYSRAVSQKAKDNDIEVILHLPMEPLTRMPLEKNTIKVGMSALQIASIINEDLADLYAVKGISNHMGSKVTQDRATMEMIISLCKRRGLFFFDSYVTGKSVCEAVAKDEGVRFTSRDVFLDNESSFDYIRGQFEKLVAIARRNGYAVGIAHDRKATLAALKRLVPSAQKDGIEFIHLSETLR
jgi:hypothetical protein